MNNKIGIIGSGVVSIALAQGLKKHKFEIMVGTNTPTKQNELQTQLGEGIAVGSFEEAAQYSNLLIFAVKGLYAEEALTICGIDNLTGKTILDATNPIADLPPEKGILQFFISPNESLMERLQTKAPQAHFVKCFNSVGNAYMVDPNFNGIQPTMFICGNNKEAKQIATTLLATIGWETEDLGGVDSAKAIEQLCILWCLPGFIQNKWNHAFKLLRTS